MSRLLKLSQSHTQAVATNSTSLLPATASQKALILKIYPNYDGDITTLTNHQVSLLLKENKTKINISMYQMMNLLNICTLNELKQILKREEVFASSITVADYEKILQIKTNPESIRLFTINHPLEIRHNYEYGWQESPLCKDGKMYYILFDNLMMMDIDIDARSIEDRINQGDTVCPCDNILSLEKIEKITLELGLTVRVYKTYNGLHIFVTSQAISYEDPSLDKITQVYGGDIYYRIFCQRYGYKIRLSPKIGRDEKEIASYLCTLGTLPEDPEMLKLLEIHDAYVSKIHNDISN